MRRGIALVLTAVLILAVAVPPAQACLECVALGLASFAVFTQLVSAIAVPRVVYPAPAYYAPAYYSVPYGWPYAPVYAPAPYYYPVSYPASYRAAPYVASAAPSAWAGPRVAQYPHGRYELRGDGVSVPYAWVWVPAAAVPAVTPVGSGQAIAEGSGATRTP
jgi:hypothetical protein